jgi:hypothetical protein
MIDPAQQLPDLYTCIDPAISEIVQARNVLVEQMARLELRLQDLTASRSHKQAASVALAAEDAARTLWQMHELAAAIHRGIAKRLALESRL